MKRFLHIVGILVVGVVIALIVLGLFVRNIMYVTTLYVEAPIEQSWATFMDDDRRGEWVSGLTGSELVSGEENAVGSHYRLVFSEADTFNVWISAIVPRKQIVYRVEDLRGTGSVDVTFAQQNNGTRIVQETTFEGSAFHWRALLPVFKPVMQNIQMRNLDMLGSLIENNPSIADVPEVIPAQSTAAPDSLQVTEGADQPQQEP